MKTRKSTIFVISILAIAVICVGGYSVYKSSRYQKEAVPEAVDASELANEVNPEESRAEAITSSQATGEAESPASVGSSIEPALPAELNLKMTFYPQAPFGNWDLPWQETCEEASVLLVANEYFHHDWTAEQFNDELLKLVEWEKTTFGDYKHTNDNQTAKILNDYLGLKTVIHENPTFEDVQKVIAKGHFIVMTFAGKHLGNPFYKNGGPNYHAMVIKGYEEGEKIITSDVGTKRGENYVYSWATLDNALHDYAEPIEDGAKRMIEVIPPDVTTQEVIPPAT